EPRESLNLKPAQYKELFLRVRGSVVKTRDLSRGTRIQVEGFVQLYRGKQWQIRMHRGMVLDSIWN
ncbi:MAG: hypothetical protein VX063_04420, partial [SAR324 cluster bacterium]|nr:hypothetical protein [SAR324 cluster bacterium]